MNRSKGIHKPKRLWATHQSWLSEGVLAGLFAVAGEGGQTAGLVCIMDEKASAAVNAHQVWMSPSRGRNELVKQLSTGAMDEAAAGWEKRGGESKAALCTRVKAKC